MPDRLPCSHTSCTVRAVPVPFRECRSRVSLREAELDLGLLGLCELPIRVSRQQLPTGWPLGPWRSRRNPFRAGFRLATRPWDPAPARPLAFGRSPAGAPGGRSKNAEAEQGDGIHQVLECDRGTLKAGPFGVPGPPPARRGAPHNLTRKHDSHRPAGAAASGRTARQRRSDSRCPTHSHKREASSCPGRAAG